MDFKDIEIDQLKEIVNIVAGNSDTALAKMLNKRITMTVPDSFAGSIEKVHSEMIGNDEIVSAIFLRLNGDLNGAMLVTFTVKDAVNLSKLLGQNATGITDLREFDKSALSEVGNVLLGTSANVLADFLQLRVEHSVPDMATDMQGAIMDSILVEIEDDVEHTLALEVGVGVEDEEINGKVYYLFDKASTKTLLERIKDK